MAIPRMNVRDFVQDAGHRRRFVDAVLKMKADGVYQIFVDWHAGAAVANVAHSNVAFLSWHRIYLRLFEIELQKADEALQLTADPGFNTDNIISLPWWDYPNLDSADPGDARGAMWQDGFLGPSGSGADQVVASGPFGSNNGQFPIQRRTSALSAPPAYTPQTPPNLTRNLGGNWPRLPSRDEIEHTVTNIDRFDDGAFQFDAGPSGSTPGSSAAGSLRAVLEGFAVTGAVKRKNESQMHNGAHVWVGGMMGVPTVSPNDPVFWIHHCNIDRLWARWQLRFPTDVARHWPSDAEIDTARTVGVNGDVNPNALQLDEPQIPWETAGRQWTAPGGAVLFTTEIYTGGDSLDWTAMGAGLGGYRYAGIDRAINV